MSKKSISSVALLTAMLVGCEGEPADSPAEGPRLVVQIDFEAGFTATVDGVDIESGYLLEVEFESFQSALSYTGRQFIFSRDGVDYTENVGGIQCREIPSLIEESDRWSVLWLEPGGYWASARGTCYFPDGGQVDWSI